jgi:hypothetical protein
MSARTLPSFLVFGLAALVLGGCSSYDPKDRIDPTIGTVDSGAGLATDFKPVAEMLVYKCGSIDCHGSKYRNFRLYGYGSERLFAQDGPDHPDYTRDEEAVEDYNSMVALEPTIYLQVIREGGANPDRLTLVRKARNVEDHKGNQPIAPGDPADLCLQSWLQSHVNADVCRSAVPRLADQ